MSHSYTFSADQAAKKYAQEHLNETDETRNVALEQIKKWLAEEKPDLHARTEDKYLLPFLRGCKFKLDKTKEKITNYYTMKRDVPEWFHDRNPLLGEVQELVKLGVFVPLKLRFENRLIVIIKAAGHNPKRHSLDSVIKVGNMILDVAALENETAQIYGVTAIFDMTGLGLGHARQLSPSLIKKAVFSWQNYHVRPKQLEFIHAPLYINVALNVFKSFMSEKLKNRVKVHFKGEDSLHQVIDINVLPPEYGGKGDSMADLIEHWSEQLISYQKWFVEDEQYKAE